MGGGGKRKWAEMRFFYGMAADEGKTQPDVCSFASLLKRYEKWLLGGAKASRKHYRALGLKKRIIGRSCRKNCWAGPILEDFHERPKTVFAVPLLMFVWGPPYVYPKTCKKADPQPIYDYCVLLFLVRRPDNVQWKVFCLSFENRLREKMKHPWRKKSKNRNFPPTFTLFLHFALS